MRRTERVSSFLAILLVLLTGCSTSLIVDDAYEPVRNTHARFEEPAYAAVAADNDCRVNALYGDELKALSQRGGNRIHFDRGLALSGGGMRAASFAMGVLEALHENDQLRTLDVVSSVSGGGYSWGWYVSHMVKADNPAQREKELFDPEGRYQELVGKRANLTPKAISLGFAAANLFPGAVWNLFANGFFGWHINTTPGRHFYEYRLRRAFNTEPDPKRRGADPTYITATWADYRAAVEAGKIPPFIINSAVLLDDSQEHISGTLANRNYEITPWHRGNDAYGYVKTDPPIDLPRAVSISGGALDLMSITPGFSQKMFISAFNFDIGYSMNNPTYERPAPGKGAPPLRTVGCPDSRQVAVRGLASEVTKRERFRQVMTPFPLYLGKSWYGRHKGGSRLYLSDGGFSDNLGAYSLIRRMTRNVIIVDAVQENEDRGHRFGAYKALKRAIREEMDAELSIPTIDDLLAHKSKAFDPLKPVMAGTVISFPTQQQPEPLVLNVMYVKLSLNPDLSTYPAVVEEYYAKVGQKRKFPYESTGDQRYDDLRYRAYRELGHTIGLCIPPFGSFSKEDPKCYQKKPHEPSAAQ
jgi:hypothetical protein